MNENEIRYTVLPDPPAPSPLPPLSWRDAAAPVLALVLSILFWAVFSLDALDGNGPGLGVLVFTLAFFAAVLVILGRSARKEGVLTGAAAIALAVSCAIYSHGGLTILNCFGILLLAAMATFLLSGQSQFPAWSILAIPETIRLTMTALFTCIDRPFRAASRASRGKSSALLPVLLTVLVTLILLAAVLALLASADMVFGSMFTAVKDWLEELSLPTVLWKVLRALVLALFIASGLYFIREPVQTADKRESGVRERRALPFLVPALALDIVYLLFCVIQVRYLFGGAETSSMAGGWAEYARTGFFQLVAVAGIDLVLCLLGTDADRFAARGGPALRIADGVMLLLTAVILASAWYRMHLYIAAYGLSVLRLMTLWGMIAILIGLLAAGWKLLRPAFSFWQVFFTWAVVTWCLFSLAGPAARTADYNVNAYLSGRLETVDVGYLRGLGCDARSALERLEDESDDYDREVSRAMTSLDRESHETAEHWTQWTITRQRGR